MLQGFFARMQRLWSTPIVSITVAPEQTTGVCQRPEWNNSEALQSLWDERVTKEPPRVLGTAGAALALLAEIQEVFAKEMDVVYSPFTERHYCRHTDWLRELLVKRDPNAPVGDPCDVSYLFGKQLRIGYVTEHDEVSGLTLETLESRDRRLQVLRLDGKIIAAHPVSVIRMESRGGVNIM